MSPDRGKDNAKKNVQDNFGEIDEISDKTRRVGREYATKLQPTIFKMEQETRMVLEGATQRIGQSKESTIVDEFWNFYSNFNSSHLPSPNEYLGGKDTAELKITVLLRLFQEHYRSSIYPTEFPAPIHRKSLKAPKTGPKRTTKLYLIGDTHGSFRDTVKLIRFFLKEFERGKKEGFDVKTCWIGDFVDRNSLDIHNLLYIITFNLKYPDNVVLLRGNHEEISISGMYGFGKNVIDNFSKVLFATFNHVFKDLPLIAIFPCDNGTIMCLHGGIPIVETTPGECEPIDLKLHKYNNRQILVDEMDPVSMQILWNDPILDYVPGEGEKYYPNRRGMGYVFGEEVFNQFCDKNDVDLLFRGHQVFTDGIHFDFNNKFITIFSASDYAGKKIRARFIEVNSTDIFGFQDYIIQDLPE